MEMGVHQYALVPFMTRPLDIVVNAMAVPRHRAEAEELSHARMQFDIRKSVANVHLHKCSTAKAEPSRRSEEHTSELQSLMRISYAVFCLKKKKKRQSNKP